MHPTGMMLSKRNLSALVGDVVRNTMETLAEAEWRAEMEHRLCRDLRHPEKKMNAAADAVVQMSRKSIEKPESQL